MPRPFKLCSVALFSLLLATPALAQDREGTQTGLLVGWSLSTISNLDARIPSGPLDKQDLQTTSINHFTYGIYARIPFTHVLAFEPELISVLKGAMNKERQPSSTTGGTMRQSAGVALDYMELPLLLRATMPLSIGGLHPFALAGPSVGLQKSCQYHAIVTDFNGYAKCGGRLANGQDVDNRYDRWEVGAVASVGAIGQIRNRNISTQLRFTQGLNNLVPTSAAPQRNRVLSILFGLELL